MRDICGKTYIFMRDDIAHKICNVTKFTAQRYEKLTRNANFYSKKYEKSAKMYVKIHFCTYYISILVHYSRLSVSSGMYMSYKAAASRRLDFM